MPSLRTKAVGRARARTTEQRVWGKYKANVVEFLGVGRFPSVEEQAMTL